MNSNRQFQKRPENATLNSTGQRPVKMNAHRRKAPTGRNQIYHKSVVDAIMATNPQGVSFVKAENYHI